MDTPYQKSQFDTCPAESAVPGAEHGGDDSAGNSAPPYSNTGGKKWEYTDPETGESFYVIPDSSRKSGFTAIQKPGNTDAPFTAITDYLNFSFPFSNPATSYEALHQDILDALGPKFLPLIDTKKGKNGYTFCFNLGVTNATIAYGGQNGTAWVSIPGQSCSLIRDWNNLIRLFGEARHGRITRWDGAVDSYNGQYSIDTALEALDAGLFNAGGRPPILVQVGNWRSPDGRGRTLNIGLRKNGKVLRVYEKGMQLRCAYHPWVRWELEVHNKDRVIPWEVLLRPGDFFVGGFPKALAWARFNVSRIKTIQKERTMTYADMTKHLKRTCGPLINVMLEVEGTPEAVVNCLIRPGSPKRLQHPIIQNPGDYIDPSSEESF